VRHEVGLIESLRCWPFAGTHAARLRSGFRELSVLGPDLAEACRSVCRCQDVRVLIGRGPLHHAFRAQSTERVHQDDHPLRVAQRAVHVVLMMSGCPPSRYETNYLTPAYVQRLRSTRAPRRRAGSLEPGLQISIGQIRRKRRAVGALRHQGRPAPLLESNPGTVAVAQSVRAPGCGPGGWGFESPRSPHSPVTRSASVYFGGPLAQSG
jgi:hypothetical protein